MNFIQGFLFSMRGFPFFLPSHPYICNVKHKLNTWILIRPIYAYQNKENNEINGPRAHDEPIVIINIRLKVLLFLISRLEVNFMISNLSV